METPWGPSDNIEDIGNGILRADTPSHGGYFVPAKLNEKIPVNLREWADSWTGWTGWYEEDCCWAAVAVTFPEFFDNVQISVAEKILKSSLKTYD